MSRLKTRTIAATLAVIAGAVALVAVLATAGWGPIRSVSDRFVRTGEPIRVGLLHSQSGGLQLGEMSLLDAETLAIEEINAEGGIHGRMIVASRPDCRSDPAGFATAARTALTQDGAVVLFGAWTAECRKALLPVLDERSSLLFFPGNFEGLEAARRVVYAGGTANQSVLPAVRWAFDSLKARRFFVVGQDEVWSRTCSEIAKDAARAAGAEVVGEDYSPPLRPTFDAAIEAIRRTKPDVVLNFSFGEANGGFYSAFRKAGLTPEATPTIAFGFGEDEARRFVLAEVAGHYAAGNYFQSLNRPENQEFVRKFRARFGESRTVGDSMVAAYNAVRLWGQAVREVNTTEIAAVINNLDRQSLDAPEGIVSLDPDSRSLWRPFHVGRMRPDGQFEIVFSIAKSIRPVVGVTTRTAEEWRSLQADLQARWRGRWSATGDVGVANPSPASILSPNR